MAAPPIAERHLHHFHRRSPIKEPVRAATTANITISTALNNGDSLDGVTLATDDRVLVKDQSTASQNGIYIVGASPARAYDQSTDDPAFGFLVRVSEGTANAGKVFANTNTATPTIGTTGLTFAEVTGSGGGSTFADLGWFNVEDYGAVHDGTTDDTSSIQDAIDACSAAGGGTVYFPAGIYQISGALQDTGTYNSQLEIPRNTSSAWVAIRFLGGGAPSPNHTQRTAILRSDWNGTISGNPSIISAGTHDSTSPSYVVVTFDNIVIEAHEDPKLSALDMTNALAVQWHELAVTTTRATPFTLPVPWTLPTHSNAVGVDMPFGLNSQPPDGSGALYVDGYYIGLRPSEQMSATKVQVAFNTQGIVFRGQQGSPAFKRHLCHIGRVASYWNPRSLVFSGDQSWVIIDALDIEHDSSPFAAIYDIDDASNYARGFINWHTTDFSTGPEDNLLVNGATGISLHGPYAKRWKLNSVVDIPTGTNPSTNPANGRRLYTDSSTGHLSARDSSGTVIDYEAGSALTIKDEGSSLATAATSIDFVGAGVTASGTGAAKTVTIPGGGIGEILISDTPSTPLVFADLLQNDDQTDLLYADP